MIGIDFDFAKYIARRRGQAEQRARDGAAYSYSGEHKVRRALVSARPVLIAIEATTRLWKGSAKKQLIGESTKASDQSFSPVYEAGNKAAKVLGIAPPAIYIAPPGADIDARALGTDDDACVVINESLIERLSDDEVLALVAHEFGHVQNNHIPYTTALFYLRHNAVFFVRWIVQPAIMTLQAWSRRAEISCDRAALLVTRNLEATLGSIIKLSTTEPVDIDDYLAKLPDSPGGVGKYAEYFRTYPLVPKRVHALRLFADSQFYRTVCGDAKAGEGMSADEVDDKVGEILSVF